MRRRSPKPDGRGDLPTRPTSSSPIGATRPSRARGLRRVAPPPTSPRVRRRRRRRRRRCKFSSCHTSRRLPGPRARTPQGFRAEAAGRPARHPTSARSSSTATRRPPHDPRSTLFPFSTNAGRGPVWGRRHNHSARRPACWRSRRTLGGSSSVGATGGRLPHGHATDAPRAAFPSGGVRKAKDEGLQVAKLLMIYNCRWRYCISGPIEGWHLCRTRVHGHPRPDFESGLQDHVELLNEKERRRRAPPRASMEEARSAVGIIHPPGASSSVKRLYDAFKQLKNDNDFSVCGRADEAQIRQGPPPLLRPVEQVCDRRLVGAYKIETSRLF